MKLVRTYLWDVINWDDVSFFNVDATEHCITQYVTTKGGQAFNFCEVPDSFSLEDTGPTYEFCAKCNSIYLEFLLKDIILAFKNGEDFYDMESREDVLWDQFSAWAKQQTNLSVYNRKPINIKSRLT